MNTPHDQDTDQPLSEADLQRLAARIPDWELKSLDGISRLERVFFPPSYVMGLNFIEKLGMLAERARHHPVIMSEFDRITIDWWTFTANGLRANDFAMAEKTDRLYAMLSAEYEASISGREYPHAE